MTLTFFQHAGFNALLQSTELASVSVTFIHRTVLSQIATGIDFLILNTPFKEPFTAFTTGNTIVMTCGFIRADHTYIIISR